MYKFSAANLLRNYRLVNMANRRVLGIAAALSFGAVLVVSLTLLTTALHLRAIATDIQDLPRSEIISSADDPDSDFAHLVENYDRAVTRLDRWMWPVRIATSALGWVPWVGDQIEGIVLLGDLAIVGNEIIKEVQQIAAPMTTAFDAFESGGTDDQVDRLDLAREAYRSASANLVKLSSSTERARQSIQQLGKLSLIPPMRATVNSAGSTVRLAAAVVETLNASAKVLAAIDDLLLTSTELEGALPSSSMSMTELLESGSHLNVVADSAETVSVELGNLEQIVRDDLGMSAVADELTQATIATEALAGLLRALAGFTDVIDRIWGTTASNPNGFLSPDGPSKQIVAVLVEEEDQLRSYIDEIASSSQVLIESSNSSLFGSSFGSFDKYMDRLDEVEGTIGIIADLPRIAAYLTGLGSERLIVVLGQSSDELRAAGGFTSSVIEMSMIDGSLARLEFTGSALFDEDAILGSRPPQPDPLRLHMQSGAWYMRDVGWSPDFRIVGASAAELYFLDRGIRPDAVVAVNQWALVRLAEALGGITTAQGFIPADKVISNLESGTDEQGTDYLGVLINDLLNSITGEILAERPMEIMLALSEMFESKELMIWADSEEIQELLLLSDWTGHLPGEEDNRLVVVDSNIGWNKVDRNIRREVRYEVDLSDLNAPVARLILVYENLSAESGRNCDFHGPYFEDNSYAVRKDGCYWNYFRTYPSAITRVMKADPLPIPAGALAVRAGTIRAGTPTFTNTFDETGAVLAGLIFIEPGETRSFEVEYLLPKNVVSIKDGLLEYHLNYFAQPGVRQRDVRVDIKFPEGYFPTEAALDAASSFEDRILSFLFDGTRDVSLTAVVESSISGN